VRPDDEGATPEIRLLVTSAGLALDAGDSLSAELGGINAADGGTALAETLALADTLADSLLVAVAVAVSGARRSGLCGLDGAADSVADVEGTTTRGAGASALAAGGFAAVVGVATVDGATVD
jgi:hypothetical protein